MVSKATHPAVVTSLNKLEVGKTYAVRLEGTFDFDSLEPLYNLLRAEIAKAFPHQPKKVIVGEQGLVDTFELTEVPTWLGFSSKHCIKNPTFQFRIEENFILTASAIAGLVIKALVGSALIYGAWTVTISLTEAIKPIAKAAKNVTDKIENTTKTAIGASSAVIIGGVIIFYLS